MATNRGEWAQIYTVGRLIWTSLVSITHSNQKGITQV